MDTAAEKVARRSTVESQYNAEREQITRDFIVAKNALEQQYQADLRENRQFKERRMIQEDLNPDGSDPQGRPQGSQVGI